jgi:hypothetical protein
MSASLIFSLSTALHPLDFVITIVVGISLSCIIMCPTHLNHQSYIVVETSGFFKQIIKIPYHTGFAIFVHP